MRVLLRGVGSGGAPGGCRAIVARSGVDLRVSTDMDDAADAVGGARNSTVNPLLYRRGEVLDSTQYGDTPPDLAKYDRTPCRGALQAACCCCARCGREELARHRAEAERARPPWRDYVLMSHPLTFMTEPAIEKARFDGTVWPSTADRFCVLLLPLLWSLLTSYGVYYGLISNPCAQVQRCYAACVATRPYAVPSDYLPISEFGGAQMCGETDYPFWQRSEWERRSYFLDYSGLVEAARLADADPSQLGPSPDLAAGSAARDSLTWEDVATRCVEAMDDLKNSRGTVSAQDVDTCHRPCVDARDSDYSAASLDQRPTCAELHHNASKYGLTHWPAPGDLVPPVGLCWSPQSVPDCEKNGVWPSTWVVQLAQSTLGVISTVVVTSMVRCAVG